jgi:Trypsin-like peptidase domain
MDLTQIRTLARGITVKVDTGDSSGSGTLLQHRGRTYTVLTNKHVLESGKKYYIQTADGHSYPAYPLKGVTFGTDDLGVLTFESRRRYTVATLQTHLRSGEAVFAAGYPWEQTTVRFNQGQVVLVTSCALEGGYQIGYSNDIAKGMSGGPLLNSHGEVVAIHGMHKYPLWGNPYVYPDGSSPPDKLKPLMTRSSWAIPTIRLGSFVPKAKTTVQPCIPSEKHS